MNQVLLPTTYPTAHGVARYRLLDASNRMAWAANELRDMGLTHDAREVETYARRLRVLAREVWRKRRKP